MFSHTNLQDVHKYNGKDIDLQELALECEELLSMENIMQIQKVNLYELFKTLCTSQNFKNVILLLTKILVAKPSSADVECLISASNLLKSPLRSAINVETKNMYLYVHYNMLPLYDWNPNMAIIIWMNNKKHSVITRSKAKR